MVARSKHVHTLQNIPAEEIQEVLDEIVRERTHSLEIKETWVLQPEKGNDRLSFEDFCWGVTHPKFRCVCSRRKIPLPAGADIACVGWGWM